MQPSLVPGTMLWVQGLYSSDGDRVAQPGTVLWLIEVGQSWQQPGAGSCSVS